MLTEATTTTVVQQEKKNTHHGVKEVTVCPSTPCPIFYSDIFGILEVRCVNSIHDNNNIKCGGSVTNQDHQDEDPTTKAGINYHD